MITLLGTGHVFDLRKRLQREILARSPDVICLELDPGRMQALLARQRGATGGDGPLTYKLLAQFQDKLASDRGIAPGDEMLAAYETAQAARLPVELIDQDAQKAFARLWREMGFLEKARFFGSTLFTAVMPRRMVDKEIEELRGDYSALLEQLGQEYPTVKRVLLDERNEHMSARLLGLRAAGRERIVAVVGDGHVEGMLAILHQKGLAGEVEVVRLRELQDDGPAPQGTATASFTVEGA